MFSPIPWPPRRRLRAGRSLPRRCTRLKCPLEWRVTPPTKEEQAKFYMPYVLALEDKAKDFYTRFPKDSHVLDARKQEFELTVLAVQLGATNQQARLDATEKSLLSDPALTEKDRFGIRKTDIERDAESKQSAAQAAALSRIRKRHSHTSEGISKPS